MIFGPVTLLWFVVLGLLGVVQIVAHPSVLAAINPWYAVQFFLRNGTQGYLILGTVVLVITGGESLYVDLGHFGRRPIRVAVVHDRPARAAAQLLRTGRFAHHRRDDRLESVLPARSGMGRVAARRTGDDGHDHRVAGSHLRGVLDHQAGGAVRLSSPADDRTHLVHRVGTDLHAGGQLGADDCLHPAGHRVQVVIESCRGLRYRRDLDDDDHVADVSGGGARAMAVEPDEDRRDRRPVPGHRSGVPWRESGEDSARRLVPDSGRGRSSSR